MTPVPGVPHPRTRYPSRQRVFDVVVVFLLLIPALLVGLLVALAVLIDSPGPVLYRSRRIGREGVPFWLLKFRTMRHLAGGPLISSRTDVRFTPVGRFLALTRLDELPQLWNVLLGDMSLVGPRPLVPEEDGQIEGLYRRRLDVPPGMTGHWQVLGSARVPIEEMVKLDYLYAANWSLWGDVRLIVRTMPIVFGRRGI